MSKIKIFALGGLNENGKNMYVVDVDNNLFVFDAGLKYPSQNMLGVDYIIPKVDYLIKNKKKIKGIFISHAHAGNMGAIPDIISSLSNVPIYATKFTMTVLKAELEKYNIKKANLKEIRPHSKIDAGGYSIFPIAVTHSIPETVAYVLYTDDGAIVYATDFVFDSSMLGAYKTDIGKLAYVGKQGVLCLLSESTYAYREGHTTPHHRIAKEVWDALNQTDDRIIINIFSEHIYKIQEIFEQVEKSKRKIVLMGKKLGELVKYAEELGYLKFDKKIIGDLSNINDKNVVILIADDKEKSYSAIEKIISKYDKYISLRKEDLVFIAEPTYPGNEKKIAKIMDDLSRIDVEVKTLSFKDHVLHHPSSEDLMQMINLMNPKYYFPIKGEYRYQYMNANVGELAGLSPDNILLKQNGDVVIFENGKLLEKSDHIEIDELLIDGNKADDVGDLVLKDRELLSKNGIVIVSATLDKKTKKIIANPQILTRGFIYVKDNLDIVNKSEEISKEVIESCIDGKKVNFTLIKTKIREALGNYFREETGSIPMVITVILEI